MPLDEYLSALGAGAHLRDYRIEGVLGAGSFGITYKAHEEITERAVAIKEYLPSALAARERDRTTVRPVSDGARADFEWGLKRFRNEARLLIGLKHRSIVPVLSYFEANGTGYLVMEFQSGRSLGQRLVGGAAMPVAELLALVPPLLDGIEAVHAAGFLHRDIKPDNIYIRDDGTPVLLDFGAARQALGQRSRGFTAVLTEGYAPHEQYQRDGNQGPWTDLYALGAVLYRCLIGRVPTAAPRRLSAVMHREADPLAAGLTEVAIRCPPRFAAAIGAALQVMESDRPQSVAELRRLLAEAPAQPEARAATTIVPPRSAPTLPRFAIPTLGLRPKHALALAAGIASLALAGALAAYFTVSDAPSPSALAPASGPARKPDPDSDARRKAEEDAARRRAEEERRRSDAERDRQERERAEERRRADEDARKRADDEARRKADEETRRAEEDARRRKEAVQRAGGLVARARALLDQARAAARSSQWADARRLQSQVAAALREAERADLAAPGLDAARRELAAFDTELNIRTADRVRALVSEARQHMQAGRYDDAQRALQEAQRLNPASPEAATALRELAEARRKSPPATGQPASRAELAAHVRQLYDQVMQWALRQPTQSLQGAPGGSYRSLQTPKALAVCVDWTGSSPGGVKFGGLGIMSNGTTNNVTRSQALDTCAQFRPNAVCTCTVVDVNDANVLAFPESYIARHYR